jgi:hypothetical protein
MNSRLRFISAAGLVAIAAVAPAIAQDVVVPIEAGTRFVFAVDDGTPAAGRVGATLRGGYQMSVAITGVTPEAIEQSVLIDGIDTTGTRRRGRVRRVVMTSDVATSRVQVLGFHSADPEVLSGTTSLGPSLEVTRALRDRGSAPYSFLNFVSQGLVTGILTRSPASPVKFALWLGTQRVEVDAIHATGFMTLNGVTRPFEMAILDHPRCPVSLRIAYGTPGANHPFVPEFERVVVRIEPRAALASSAGPSGR